jgi:hypothetical protein
MAGLIRRFSAVVLLAAGWAAAGPALACPFCASTQGPSLTGEAGQAVMVLYGNLADGEKDNTTGEPKCTILTVEAAVKKNKAYEGQKVISLARWVPLPEGTTRDTYRYLVFCDVFKGKVDPYRILPVQKDATVVKYLQGALALKDAAVGQRLRFFFDYLDSADLEVSNDAYKEFANADYKDYRDMAKDLPADRIAAWLDPENPKSTRTPSYRFGLYASMLGHCGTKKHAEMLRKLLDSPERRVGSGVDGILAGYVMLEPKEGWNCVRGIFKDAKKEFLLRYAALRAARFLWDYRPDLVSHKEVAESAAAMLEQNDVADLVVDDLRKWACWDMTDRVLGLQGKKVSEVPVVRRAVLRFALSCPNDAARRYVAEQRAKNAQWVADVEELLKLEQTPPSPPTAAK